ncbi:MAG: hypothetical protein M3O50_09110, partial [Myxococcota bacterium]|nr:hypothetical protein [Myxococcota bacterium]
MKPRCRGGSTRAILPHVMPVPGRRAAVPLLAAASYAVLSFASAPPWPDDWDGVGFVESIRDFDLARFHPHPPGYPVYVALLRVTAAIVRDPMRAATVTSVLCGVVVVTLVWDAARRVAGE